MRRPDARERTGSARAPWQLGRMPTVTERGARCRIFTFKEGLLSAVAHDLELEVGRFSIAWNDDRSKLDASFDAGSIRVLHAMVNGRAAPEVLSARDREKIERNIAEDVLRIARHPRVEVEGTLAWDEAASAEPRARFDGTLRLVGCARPLRLDITHRDGVWRAETSIHQPDFGITPYSAMLGALKIRADVRVVVEVFADR